MSPFFQFTSVHFYMRLHFIAVFSCKQTKTEKQEFKRTLSLRTEMETNKTVTFLKIGEQTIITCYHVILWQDWDCFIHLFIFMSLSMFAALFRLFSFQFDFFRFVSFTFDSHSSIFEIAYYSCAFLSTCWYCILWCSFILSLFFYLWKKKKKRKHFKSSTAYQILLVRQWHTIIVAPNWNDTAHIIYVPILKLKAIAIRYITNQYDDDKHSHARHKWIYIYINNDY